MLVETHAGPSDALRAETRKDAWDGLRIELTSGVKIGARADAP